MAAGVAGLGEYWANKYDMQRLVGLVVEFLDVIGPLTDSEAHGGSAVEPFHVVVPALPGFGFSDKPSRAGIGIEWIAVDARRICDLSGLYVASAYRYTVTVDHPGVAQVRRIDGDRVGAPSSLHSRAWTSTPWAQRD